MRQLNLGNSKVARITKLLNLATLLGSTFGNFRVTKVGRFDNLPHLATLELPQLPNLAAFRNTKVVRFGS